ncbi:MAG: restriction endonuclease subunit S [Bacteroidaceae bacterium]|nr:restriction endonuclease subunit S [Bacteroidaceae bacterium]
MRKGWDYKKLNEVCDKGSSNVVINKLVDNNGDYPLFGASGLVKNVDFFHQDKEYIGIVKDGAGVGRVNTYPAYSSLVGTMQYIFPKEQCLLNYVKYFLVKLDLSHCVSGATIPHIYFKDYGKELIPVPSLEEQQSIVAELDEINNLLSLKRKELETYDKLAQSLFYEMFGDPVENEKGWEKRHLRELFEVTSSKRILQENWGNGDVPFLKVSEIVSLIQGENFEPSTFISEGLYSDLESINQVPMEGDVLITARGTLGLCYIVQEGDRFYFQDGMVTWLRKNTGNINTTFLKYLFKNEHFLSEIMKQANKSTVAYLSIKQTGLLDIIVPHTNGCDVQQLFAQRIEAIEQQKAQGMAAIEKLETLLAARMQYWFE